MRSPRYMLLRDVVVAIVTLAELEEGASLARFDDSRWDGRPEVRQRK